MKHCIVCSEEIKNRGPQAKYCQDKCKETARPTSGMMAPRYKFRMEKRIYLDEYKMERGCETCGYNQHPAALTLDHIDPSTKLFTPSHGVTRNWDVFLAEIQKCRVLCANCHNIHSQSGRTYDFGKTQEKRLQEGAPTGD